MLDEYGILALPAERADCDKEGVKGGAEKRKEEAYGMGAARNAAVKSVMGASLLSDEAIMTSF